MQIGHPDTPLSLDAYQAVKAPGLDLCTNFTWSILINYY